MQERSLGQLAYETYIELKRKMLGVGFVEWEYLSPEYISIWNSVAKVVQEEAVISAIMAD